MVDMESFMKQLEEVKKKSAMEKEKPTRRKRKKKPKRKIQRCLSESRSTRKRG
jgi:hypothetical protein